MHNKHGHENRYKLYKAIRKFSSLAAWKCFRKSSILELKGLKVKWLNRINVRRLSWDFISTDFITPFNFLTIKPFNPNALAFTMAEILISLTIIGVIAAITLPSLRANINEKAWTTQRNALYSRISQAVALIGNLNGYGVGATSADTNNNATAAFVTDGLNKVLKINNICDNEHFSDCGLPTSFKTFKSSSKANFPKTLHELNLNFSKGNDNPTKNVNTKAVAFETQNGESIAVYYNPYCIDKNVVLSGLSVYNSPIADPIYILPYMCANFIYDLNGKKGPNTVGKDIWYMSVLYSNELDVSHIEPNRISKYFSSNNFNNYNDAKNYCASIDARMATVEEGIANSINESFVNTNLGFLHGGYVVSTTFGGVLTKYSYSGVGVRCIYKKK